MFTLTAEQKHTIAAKAGGAVRAGAALVIAYAVRNHWIPGSGAMATWLGDQLTTELAGGITWAAMLLWSWMVKNKDKNRLVAAIVRDPLLLEPTLEAFLTDFKAEAAARTSDHVSIGPTAKILLVLALAGGAGLVLPSCASAPIVHAANAEHLAVTAVHAVIQAEAAAYRAGAYDDAHHQQYVAALLKVTLAEKALNDALTGWNAGSGQPMPAQVTIAVQSLTLVLADVTPLIPQNSQAAALAASATAAIQALAGGK